MKITDLYQVATLGNKIDENGFVKITFNHKIDLFFEKFRDIFLIFKDHSVRYVTIQETIKYERGYKIKLLEKELYNDIVSDGKTKVCLEKKDVPDLPPEVLYSDFDVYSGENFFGKVIDIMDAKFNEVFVISCDNDKEITIPNVAHFIQEIDKKNKIIRIKNHKELLDLL